MAPGARLGMRAGILEPGALFAFWAGRRTMYDFDDSTDIFEIFEVGLANSHILVGNDLATTNLAIFGYWRPHWRFGSRHFAKLAIWRSPLRHIGDLALFYEYLPREKMRALSCDPPNYVVHPKHP